MLPQGKQRFLIVEDDRNVLMLLERALTARNRAIQKCVSAAAALRAFEEAGGAFSLVIADVVLPDLSGPDMVRLMLIERPDLKVIFVTGYSDEIVETYLAELRYEVLHKPFTVMRLREAVSAALGTRG
jgi:two-component system cell cycle sensor histidine kinase/response regulator CckA